MSRAEDAPWPLPPLIPGDWRTLSAPDATAVVARFAAAEVERGLEPLTEQLAVSRVRACPLRCAPAWLLIEAEARMHDGAAALLTLLFGPGRRIEPIAWAPYVIADLLWERERTPVDLDVIKHFLILAVNCTVGESDRFRLLDSGAELTAVASEPGAVPEELRQGLEPVSVAPTGDGYSATGTVAYGDSVFRSEFHIDPDGALRMTDDEAIREVPLRRERFFGPLRIAVTT